MPFVSESAANLERGRQPSMSVHIAAYLMTIGTHVLVHLGLGRTRDSERWRADAGGIAIA